MAFIDNTSFSSWLPAESFFASESKITGEDPFAAIFSPVHFDDEKMMIEETPSMETLSTSIEESILDLSPLSSSPSDLSAENRSKDGLKFSRKLASLMLDMVHAPSDMFDQIMKFSTQVLLNLLNPLKLDGVTASEIRNIQNECLERMWTEFKDLLSYSKNKKICIVKQEYWNTLFDKKSSTAYLKQLCESLSKTWKTPAGKQVLSDAVFCELFSQVLFYANKLAVIVLIQKDTSSKGKFLRELKTIDNFYLMVLLPELMQLYNHKRGKFALECCMKCKICKSKLIPYDFLSTLAESRKKMESVVFIINQIFEKYGDNSFETGSCLVEFGLTQL